MYEPHGDFTPANQCDTIWRYVDFTKFVSMLESSCLYFCCAEKLQDKFEGAFARPLTPDDVMAEAISHSPEKDAFVRKRSRYLKRTMFINCWHLSEHESAAMWVSYLQSNEGVAIASTFERLTRCFKGEEAVFIGKVSYLDYNKACIPAETAFRPFLCKRKSFEYEKELRAVYWDTNELFPYLDPNDARPAGKELVVDLDMLIDAVYVAPTAPGWLHKLVESVLKRYGLNKPVKQSDLAKDPVW